MTTNNDGGPAFPRAACNNSEDGFIWDEGDVGMTLRDYFAAKAMQGLLADSNTHRGYRNSTTGLGWPLDMDEFVQAVSEQSYLYADAMLAEREKKGGAL